MPEDALSPRLCACQALSGCQGPMDIVRPHSIRLQQSGVWVRLAASTSSSLPRVFSFLEWEGPWRGSGAKHVLGIYSSTQTNAKINRTSMRRLVGIGARRGPVFCDARRRVQAAADWGVVSKVAVGCGNRFSCTSIRT